MDLAARLSVFPCDGAPELPDQAADISFWEFRLGALLHHVTTVTERA
jgi:uncharacterized protein Usg